MPVITGKVIYDNLLIKEPTTLRININKNELVSGKSRVGTVVGNKTIAMVAWGTITSMCPEIDPECANPSKGVEITVVCDGTKYVLQMIFGSFYVSPQVMFVYEIFNVGKETDLTIDVVFRGSRVSVYLNGTSVIDTDMMKKFGSIRMIAGNNRAIATDNTEVDIPLQHLVDIVATTDISQVFNAILPIAISIGVIGAVFGVIKYVLPALRR